MKKKKRDGWTASSSKVANKPCHETLLHRSHCFFFVFLLLKELIEHNGVYTATCDGGAGLDLDGGYGERAASPGSKRLPVFCQSCGERMITPLQRLGMHKCKEGYWGSVPCSPLDTDGVLKTCQNSKCQNRGISILFMARPKLCATPSTTFSCASNVIRKAFES